MDTIAKEKRKDYCMELNNLTNHSLADINAIENDILNILLFDRTTRENIVWATSDYENYGEAYRAGNPIHAQLISGNHSDIIQPRATKEKISQLSRTKDKAEVFTPSWMCNIQNNLIDAQWFGNNQVFNIEQWHSWRATTDAVIFPKKKGFSWKDYVDEKRLEITCGEAPYLVSRYDAVSGLPITLSERIGLLDRKMRVVNENAQGGAEWYQWTKRAFESIYGFEYQGDNLLLARENLLFSFTDYYTNRFCQKPEHKELREIAHIISWNIWQMDGIRFTAPYMSGGETLHQTSKRKKGETDKPVYCKIRDWRSNKTVYYYTLVMQEGE